MKHLASLSIEDLKAFFASFDMIISDCDGVLWQIEDASGVEDAVNELHRNNIPIKLLTNNALRDLKAYDTLCSKIGIQRTDENFIHPTDTAVDYLVKNGFVGKTIYTIAPPNTNEAIKQARINVTTAPSEYPNSLSALLLAAQAEEVVQGVFVDVDLQLNYLKIARASTLLQRSGVHVPLIVGATDRMLPVGKLIFPGPGYFLDAITGTSSRVPVILGKPGLYLRDVVNERFQIKEPKRVLFIGDSLEQDIFFGHLCDFQTLLVLTGSTSKEHLYKNSNPFYIPDYYLNSFADLSDIIKRMYPHKRT